MLGPVPTDGVLTSWVCPVVRLTDLTDTLAPFKLGMMTNSLNSVLGTLCVPVPEAKKPVVSSVPQPTDKTEARSRIEADSLFISMSLFRNAATVLG